MKYAYYKDAMTGKIRSYHKIPDTMTDEELEINLRKYNSRTDSTDNARIVKVQSGSFMEYLIKRDERKEPDKQESINEALDSLKALQDALENLRQ